MNASPETSVQRRVDTLSVAKVFGADAQVDRRRMALPLDNERDTDPFLMLSEDWFGRVGFEWHPHRGFETVTYVISGQLEHRDNAGGQGLLGPGDVQWTTTGRGVIHSELAHRREPVHMLQLWLNLPADRKMVPPRYQDLRAADAPVHRAPGVELRVFAGEMHGVRGPAQLHWPVTFADLRLEAGARFLHQVPADHAAFLYVLEGAVKAGPEQHAAPEGKVIWSDPVGTGTSTLELVADQPSRLVAYSGPRIREPIASYGPFVMNTREEIVAAIHDYQSGKFGQIPE